MLLPDLSSLNCVHFVLSGRITRGLNASSVRQLIGRPLPQYRNFIEIEEYERNSSPHRAIFRLTRTTARSTQINVHFDCGTGQTDGGAPVNTPVTDYLRELNSFEIRSQFQYQVLFELGRKASHRLFPLRWPILGTSAVDEIRGFRAVKYQVPTRTRYDLSIESPELRELYISVEFKRELVFNTALFQPAIEEAAGVARQLVPEEDWSK